MDLRKELVAQSRKAMAKMHLTRAQNTAREAPKGTHPPARVGVIGLGPQGRDFCHVLEEMKVGIAAVADRRPEALDSASQFPSSPARFDDAAAMLERQALDLVIVATNTPGHLPLANLALGRGVRSIIVEKPIGTSVAAARALQALAAQSGAKVTVNHSRRWSTDYRAIRSVIERGIIGDLRKLHSIPGPGAHPGLANLGVHFLDLLFFLSGKSPVSVRGFLDPSDQPNARGAEFADPPGRCLIELEGGIRASLDVDADGTPFDGMCVIKGTQGKIVVDERLRKWTVSTSDLGEKSFAFQGPAGVRSYCRAVLSDVLRGGVPRVGIQEGIQALEAVVAAHVSHERGGIPIELPMAEELARREFAFP